VNGEVSRTAVQEVGERIRNAIEDHGPIAFDEFMELALYSPGGFYDRPPVGEVGHFVTSPHVHPVFADLLRFALDQLREALGSPDPFPVVELGAGDGTLARQLLAGYAEIQRFGLDYTAVEVSAGARERLAELPIRVLERVEDLPADPRCLFGNELLDNLPFRRVVRTADGPKEIRIAANGTVLVEVTTQIGEDLSPFLGDGARDGELVVPTGALRLIDRLAPRVRGYLLLIDYGASGPSAAGTVHGYRQHRVLADVLADPGSVDITAGVDFDTVAARAEAAGLRSLGLVTQRDALLSLGFDRWDRGQFERQTGALAEGHGPEAIGAWQSRQRAGILVDRMGLGRLRWLLLTRPPLGPPPWLEEALAGSGPQPD
jgi:SAM-dependent MidA family methyltransferase